ncbi:MAG: carbohydrate ABC transporter permease [Dongiaceae bacterium]
MSLGSTTVGRAARTAIPHLILIAFSAGILLPLLWLLRVALTDKLTAYQIPPEWAALRLDNFIEIFQRYHFGSFFVNSLVAAIGSTAIALPLATAMAYAFARHNTGGSTLRLFVLASQMLPPVILVLPMYSLFLFLGLINSWTGLIVAHLTINIPFLAWMLVAFFQGDTEQLEQAARIDGASRFQAFLRVAVPVAAPGLLAAGLLAFILSWNEFLFALILTGKATNTLPVGLAGFSQSQRGVEIALLAAATMVAILPVFILLPFMRRYLIKGLSLGALK